MARHRNANERAVRHKPVEKKKGGDWWWLLKFFLLLALSWLGFWAAFLWWLGSGAK